MGSASAAAEAPPQRIVSLNLCVDQILIDLVAPERIAALSFLATDATMSAVAHRAHAYKRVRGAAEDVLVLDPDLVFAGRYSTPATRNLLRRLGKRVVVVDQPATLDGIRRLIRLLATAVGAAERGEAMIAAFDRRLAHAVDAKNRRDEHQPTAMALEVNSIVSLPGSLLDDVLQFVGLKNMAATLGHSRGGRVALETLVLTPPDVLVLANAPEDFRTVLADNLRHPVLKTLQSSRPHVALPMWSTLCGTPYVATAVERLADARRQVLAVGGTP
ncbi:MAG: ABC transporter substrate-binding protein [Alphaproteobacteria bacterium]|nr:ABC transporter substrate-binding protein [Alphaproteobacteria bacterium]